MRSAIKQVLRRARALVAPPKAESSLDYWEDRARKFGRRAVLNLSHPDSEFERVTSQQRQLLLPLLSAQLRGDERRVLDFGCGPGRFTKVLADTISGEAIGFDISRELIAIAPPAANVRYLAGSSESLKHEGKFDIIWICLVLGGIAEPVLRQVAEILTDRLQPDGLLFLVENTTKKADVAHWFYRDDAYYLALFPHIRLQRISTYDDAGEQVTVWAGRKHT